MEISRFSKFALIKCHEESFCITGPLPIWVTYEPMCLSIQWRHNGHHGVSTHQSHHCLLRSRSKKTSKLCITGLCAGKSLVTGEFPAQMACNAENGSIWWRHHVIGWSRNKWSFNCHQINLYTTGPKMSKSKLKTREKALLGTPWKANDCFIWISDISIKY